MVDNIGRIYVPSEGDPSSKLWIVGEAPGWTEEQKLRPFIGESGGILETVLGRAGKNRSEVFLTNLCHFRPPGNKFQALFGSDKLREGLAELHDLLSTHRPNVVAACGAFPLKHLTDKDGITKFRGSILPYDGTRNIGSINYELKVIPTFHPAFILRNRPAYPVFDVDIRRIVADSTFPELKLPDYEIVVDPSELDMYVEQICNQEFTASDIESVKGTTQILCIGFSISASKCIVIPYRDDINTRTAIARILSARVKKVFHFGAYDVTVLRINGFDIANYTDDTIIQAHVLDPELPRDLAHLCSVLTRQPYYKVAGRSHIPGDIKGWSRKRNKEELYIYNGKDVCCTHSIYETQRKDLQESGMQHYYEYRMELQQSLLEIGDNGLLRDNERAAQLAHATKVERAKCVIFLRTLAGYKVRNVANKEMCKLLYETLKLPERKKTDRKTGKQRLTTDEDAIVSLITYCSNHVAKLKTAKAQSEWNTKREILKLVLKIRGQNKLLESYLEVPMYLDGRCHTTYRTDGTETGRCSNRKYVDKSGLNIQTIPRDSIEVPDVAKEVAA